MGVNRARYLTRNEGSEAPSNIVFVDTESYKEQDSADKHKYHYTLRLWCAIRCRLENGQVTRRITSQGKTHTEFWNWLHTVSDDNRCTWVFAHNLGFDLTQLHFWEQLDAGEFTTEPLYRSSENQDGSKQKSWQGKMCLEHSPTFVVVRRGRRTFKFVDSVNYWPKSLDTIGRNIGIRKHQMPGFDRPDYEWYNYCMQDCRVLEASIVGLIERWKREDCGVFQMTAASLSMTNFRHTCDITVSKDGPVDIVCEPNAKEHELEREAYFGGRIGCFYIGRREERIYHLDVNSLYPAVMSTNLFPRRFVGYDYNPSVHSVIDRMRVYGVVARVFVRSRYETYPVRVDGEQYHAVGNYWASLCGPELLRAIDSGSVDKIDCLQFYSVAHLFTKWVGYWYQRKLEAIDKGESGKQDLEFCKLVLNSLSGKWAQRSRHWIDQPGRYPMKRWGGWSEYNDDTCSWDDYRGIGGCQQKMVDGGEPAHSFPLISAYITAYGREYMRKLINYCPDGSVLYMATDSLICTEDAYASLAAEGFIDDRKLGSLRVVGVHNSCDIHGPNYYALDDVETSTGLRGKAIAAKKRGGSVEMFEQLPGIVSRGAVHDVVVREVKVPRIHPVFRGTIDEMGYWHPYRITNDPDFTDRPPKPGYSFDGSSDTEGDHIRLLGPLS